MRTTLLSAATAGVALCASALSPLAHATPVSVSVSIQAPIAPGVLVGAQIGRVVPVVVGAPVVVVPAPVVIVAPGFRHRHHHFRNDFRGYRDGRYRY